MNANHTLENSDPTSQEEVERQLRFISEDLGNTRLMMRVARREEKSLMERRKWLRLQLSMLQEPAHITVPAEVSLVEPDPLPFNGTTQPSCPDCTEADNL